MVEWGDADDDGYPDTEEGHNEYEKDCQSGKQPYLPLYSYLSEY